MKYIREQLEKMSDFEINKALAKKLGKLELVPSDCEEINIGDKVAYYDKMRCINICNEAYCEDWSEIMPLAVEYGIEIIYEGDSAVASTNAIATYMEDFDSCEYFKSESPQRAIACCLLMMEIEK